MPNADTLKMELEESRPPPGELVDSTSLRQELQATKKQLLEAQSQVDLTNEKFASLLDELHDERKRALTAEDDLRTLRETCSNNTLQINSIETQLKQELLREREARITAEKELTRLLANKTSADKGQSQPKLICEGERHPRIPSNESEVLNCFNRLFDSKMEDIKTLISREIAGALGQVKKPPPLRVNIPPPRNTQSSSTPLEEDTQNAFTTTSSCVPLEGEFQVVSRKQRRKRQQSRSNTQDTLPETTDQVNMVELEPPTASTIITEASMYTHNRTTDRATYSKALTQSGTAPGRQPKRNRRAKPQTEKPTAGRGPPVAKQLKRLILPSRPGEIVTNVLEEAGISPEEIGLKGAPITFPSGAALIRVAPNQAEKLEEALKKVGLRAKESLTTRPFEFRIHRLPENMREEDVRKAIAKLSSTSSTPHLGITVSDYSQSNQQARDLKLKVAYIECDKDTFDVISKRRSIQIGWRTYPTDSKIRLMACSKCGLLGHTKTTVPTTTHTLQDGKRKKKQPGTAVLTAELTTWPWGPRSVIDWTLIIVVAAKTAH